MDALAPLDAITSLGVASDPKEVKWYDTDHFFNEQARRDRGNWLDHTLQTAPPP